MSIRNDEKIDQLDWEAMDLEDLQRLASDRAKDPEIAQRAAVEIETRTRKQRSLVGSAGIQVVERTLKVILTEEAWDEMVDAAQRFTGKTGIPKAVGAIREWSCSYEIGSLTLGASAFADKTRIQILSKYNGALFLAWMTGPILGLMTGGLVGRAMFAAGNSKGLVIALGVAICLAFVLATYSAIRWWEARRRPKLLDLLNTISKKAEESGIEPPSEVPKAGGYLS